jgi:hypothetical protein
MAAESYIFLSARTYTLTTAVAAAVGDVANRSKKKKEKRNERKGKIDGQACDRRYCVHIHVVYIYMGIMRMCSFCSRGSMTSLLTGERIGAYWQRMQCLRR